jgi:hypothetical protein
MDNRIAQVDVQIRRLDPVEAELWITAMPEPATPGTEIRGRIVGPRCAGVTTIEVAYPLRPMPQQVLTDTHLAARVVIPEPSRWTPETPFLYTLIVELWRDGQRSDRRTIAGIRLTRGEPGA